MESQFLFVVEVLELPFGNRGLELEGRFAWKFLFVVEASEPPVGNQELELEDRFAWNFNSSS